MEKPNSTIEWAKFDSFDPDSRVHQNFVFGNWCKHIRSFEGYRRKSRDEFRLLRRRIGEIVTLNKPTLAHSIQGEPYYGFICAEYRNDQPILHMLYVKDWYRRQGIATALMKIALPTFRKETIYHTFPMQRVKHFRDKWKLEYKPELRYAENSKDNNA